MTKKRKPSFVVKVYENSNSLSNEGFCVRQGTNVFEIHVPKRLPLTSYSGESTPEDMKKEYRFAIWCHEFGHAIAGIFGLTYSDLETRTPHWCASSFNRLVRSVLGVPPEQSVLKAEKEVWKVAEVIASFDRCKKRGLDSYYGFEKRKIEENFHRLFVTAHK